MTPGQISDLPIYIGSKWTKTLEFVAVDDDGVETPLDLTGLGPFVMEMRSSNGNCLLAEATITGDYDETGELTFSFSAVQTSGLVVGNVLISVYDAELNPYVYGTLAVRKFK